MFLALWLAQAMPGDLDSTTIIRLAAGLLALVLVVAILVRRKRKTSKQDWS